MSNPPSLDANRQADDLTDPEAPRLTDLDNPEPEPGTDIVPPEASETGDRREGVVSDPDTAARPAP